MECQKETIEAKLFYAHGRSEVAVGSSKAEFITEKGVRQGDSLSPLLFILVLQYALKTINWRNKGIDIGGKTLSYLAYADDIVILAHDLESVKTIL